MKLPKLLHFSALLLLSFLAVASARAQQPIAGGTLYSAAPGPVTMELLAGKMPDTYRGSWSLEIAWPTGPGYDQYAVSRTTRHDPGYEGIPTGGMFGTFQPFFANVTPGAKVSTPPLGAGTSVFFPANMLGCVRCDQAYQPGSYSIYQDVYAGMPAPGYYFQPNPLPPGWAARNLQPAAVFPGENNTARIGYAVPAGGPLSSNFLDYPVRILVGNICVN
jgi:hypothetical protein